MSENALMVAMQAAFNQAVQAAVSAHITQLQQQHANVVGELATKVAALETRLTEAQLFTRNTDVTVQLDKAQIIEALDQQEWFWGKLKSFIDENTPAVDLEELAASVDLETLADHLDISTLAGELTDSQLSDIAGDIDLSDLAGELDPEKIADRLDIDEMIRDFFQNNTFSIRP
jgi:hypothetical protein